MRVLGTDIMIGSQLYQQMKPCIDHQGHKFAANLVRVVVCERCGITRQQATGSSREQEASERSVD